MPSLPRLRRLLGRAFLAAALLWAVSWLARDRLVGPRAIRPALLREPSQAPTARAPFAFDYRGKSCRVRPIAEYELWGLVVSHNNVGGLTDMYHDASSVDTKDLCVVWGENLTRPDYRRVEFRSGSFTCTFRYPHGVRLRHDGVANTHLITASDELREGIAAVRVGDQVRLAGLLVDYQMEDWGGAWRRTSTSRRDADCEVLLVEELEVLARGRPGWHLAHRASGAALVAIPLLYLLVAWREAGRPGGSLGRLT